MNANKRVFLFVFLSFLCYISLSYIHLAYQKKWGAFDRINLLADIVAKKAPMSTDFQKRQKGVAYEQQAHGKADSLSADSARQQTAANPRSDTRFLPLVPADLNTKSIVSFLADSNSTMLVHFIRKLNELKSGKKVKIRIAYLGDSMIEGDLLSQTLRSLLQQKFGGAGVGFVPITSQVAQFRKTALATSSTGWRDINFKNSKRQDLFISGHSFYSSGDDWVKIRDNTSRDTSTVLEKYLLYGPGNDTAAVIVGKKTVKLDSEGLFNRHLISSDKAKFINLSGVDTSVPLFGISFESPSGVIVDNFSFRGISGLEFGRLNSGLLKEIDRERSYDLIIFQYGVNVLYKPDDVNFSWYKRAAIPVINKMKACFSQADVLIVGTGDRAFRYPEGYQSALGIESLIMEQANLAKQTGCPFFSLYAAMGGKNSMVDWANQNPSLANKDYVHPNALGARILGKYLFEALQKETAKNPVEVPAGE